MKFTSEMRIDCKIMLGLCNLRSLEMAATNLHRPKRMNPFTDGKTYMLLDVFLPLPKIETFFLDFAKRILQNLAFLDLQNHGGRYGFLWRFLRCLAYSKTKVHRVPALIPTCSRSKRKSSDCMSESWKGRSNPTENSAAIFLF